MSAKNNESKKAYTKPTVTDHGKLTEETKGIVGTSWEVFGHQPADETKGN
ncbi:MAG TPA: hypothetical protein VM100_07690 [Longimicrobiales bacterium]|nr:hypothetical protein [Longimicrobiales bacterium]